MWMTALTTNTKTDDSSVGSQREWIEGMMISLLIQGCAGCRGFRGGLPMMEIPRPTVNPKAELHPGAGDARVAAN
jgi:hypothetical protein